MTVSHFNLFAFCKIWVLVGSQYGSTIAIHVSTSHLKSFRSKSVVQPNAYINRTTTNKNYRLTAGLCAFGHGSILIVSRFFFRGIDISFLKRKYHVELFTPLTQINSESMCRHFNQFKCERTIPIPISEYIHTTSVMS